ncbi:hypothetical protein GE454_03065 [Pseudomonas soli]|nr:hypothetical protein [Pseudomonas soli]
MTHLPILSVAPAEPRRDSMEPPSLRTTPMDCPAPHAIRQITSLALLATDTNGSTLTHHGSVQPHDFTYTAFGCDLPSSTLLPSLGFNAQLRPSTGLYLLGNGYRAFNTALMRFCSTDSLSPFNDGGLHTYAYCAGDPINHTDPDGHTKYGKLQPFRQISSKDRKAVHIEQQRAAQHEITALSKKIGALQHVHSADADGNLKSDLLAQQEQAKQNLQAVDTRIAINEHTLKVESVSQDPGQSSFHQLANMMNDPATIAADKQTQQEAQGRIDRARQKNADVRQGKEYWR